MAARELDELSVLRWMPGMTGGWDVMRYKETILRSRIVMFVVM